MNLPNQSRNGPSGNSPSSGLTRQKSQNGLGARLGPLKPSPTRASRMAGEGTGTGEAACLTGEGATVPGSPDVLHANQDVSPAELPPVNEAFLTEAEVVAVLDDIQQFGEQIQWMQRRNATRLDGQPGKQSPPLGAATEDAIRLAKESLLGGKIARVQVRYRWQNSLWIDTFERRGDRIRLVRICHRSMG